MVVNWVTGYDMKGRFPATINKENHWLVSAAFVMPANRQLMNREKINVKQILWLS